MNLLCLESASLLLPARSAKAAKKLKAASGTRIRRAGVRVVDRFDRDQFIMKLPVWMIADLAVLTAKGFPDCITIMNSGPMGRFFPLFTDSDLVKQFIEEANLSDKRPLCLYGESTRILLADFQKTGVEQVGIDVSFKPPKRGRFVPIQEVLNAIPPDQHSAS
jgi:hypothetical protein